MIQVKIEMILQKMKKGKPIYKKRLLNNILDIILFI